MAAIGIAGRWDVKNGKRVGRNDARMRFQEAEVAGHTGGLLRTVVMRDACL
jgi:hypothetical protein